MTERDSFNEVGKVCVFTGSAPVLEMLYKVMDAAKDNFDVYADFNGPNIVDDVSGIAHYIDAKKRGVKTRVITEITKDNLEFCKENMRYIYGLRHMDTITHMFEVSEKQYASAMLLNDNPHFLEGVFSDIPWFVNAQRYLFETIWRKAIPAKQRFKEIEEGSKREFIDSIRDPVEILELIDQILQNAYEELLILIPKAHILDVFLSSGYVEALDTQINKYGITVKFIIGVTDQNEPVTRERIVNWNTILKHNNIEIHYDNNLDTRLMTIIADTDKLLSIEVQDVIAPRLIDIIGLGTYSNSTNTIMSYHTTFETLWLGAKSTLNKF